ncbi:MAG TPA: sigma-E factor regulatory protein RseB domain-containing protein [Planctomycetota bacterium]|nr:sigma-E factor regulatory protein RseB domain-containing protein [Planctomycetota bacterium]
MRVKLPVAVAFFLLTAGAISWGVLTDAREARLQAFLTSIEAAEETIPYVGTRVVGGVDTVKLRIWSREGHKRVDFLGIEGKARPRPGSRIPLVGAVPVFLRPGHEQWKRKIKDAALAVRNYEVVVLGRDVIAGRDCEVIDVRSRHEGRPSYRVAADLANRFPLRYEVFSKGERVFETHFAEIQYHPAVSSGTFQERQRPNWLNVSQEEVAAERMTEAAGFSVLRPSYVPRGFELRGSELLRVKAELSKELRETIKPFLPFPMPKLDATVAHLTYTDGLAAVAVVECSASSELWQHLKKLIPPAAAVPSGKVAARKFSDRGGSAYLLETEGTVVLVAGNVDSEEIESMIRTLERR